MKMPREAFAALVVLASALALGVSPGDAAAQAEAGEPPPPVASASTPTPVSPEALRIVRRVQGFYDQTRTFKADFKQEFTVRAHGQKKASEGSVVFAKPGKMSFTYKEPNGNRVVSDGHVLKIYERENQQMFEQPVDKSQYPAALSFLMGQGNLEASFRFRVLDAGVLHFEGGYVLEGAPSAPTPAYQKVLLYVDGATYQVRRVLILDAQGNRNRFDFSSPSVNTETSASDFELTPPAGTQIVQP